MDQQFHLLNSALLVKLPGTEDWNAMGKHLRRLHHSINWWIGDFHIYGERQLGENFYQFVDDDMSHDLIRRCVRVSQEFEVGERFERLSWSHHNNVIPLSKPMRRAVLTMAQKNKWSSGQVRDYVKEITGEQGSRTSD